MFFNTTSETNPELATYKAKADTQEETILAFFEEAVHPCYTPSEIWKMVLHKAPLTSVRRAMTNLSTEGKLKKTIVQRKGYYGRLEHSWRLVNADPKQGSLL